MMNKDNRNDKIRKIAKKGLTLSLCAVLAGGLAAGSFEGVNKLAGWSGATTVEAASNKDETTLTYAKSEKKDADTSDSKSDTGKDTVKDKNVIYCDDFSHVLKTIYEILDQKGT